MKCPYCNIVFYFEASSMTAFPFEDEKALGKKTGFGVTSAFCPNCNNFIILYIEGKYHATSENQYILEPFESYNVIFPQNRNNIVLENVPQVYKENFEEAYDVLSISPKASAALSRRSLQMFLREELNINEKSLAKEIQYFIDNEKLPTYILDAVDAIRNIGNFAAHPLKNTNTGEIVDVEVGEAEWLIEVLELLFDFYFTQPIRLANRKKRLNKKLQELGKPKMK